MSKSSRSNNSGNILEALNLPASNPIADNLNSQIISGYFLNEKSYKEMI